MWNRVITAKMRHLPFLSHFMLEFMNGFGHLNRCCRSAGVFCWQCQNSHLSNMHSFYFAVVWINSFRGTSLIMNASDLRPQALLLINQYLFLDRKCRVSYLSKLHTSAANPF